MVVPNLNHNVILSKISNTLLKYTKRTDTHDFIHQCHKRIKLRVYFLCSFCRFLEHSQSFSIKIKFYRQNYRTTISRPRLFCLLQLVTKYSDSGILFLFFSYHAWEIRVANTINDKKRGILYLFLINGQNTRDDQYLCSSLVMLSGTKEYSLCFPG
jgi:hypothetical protein